MKINGDEFEVMMRAMFRAVVVEISRKNFKYNKILKN